MKNKIILCFLALALNCKTVFAQTDSSKKDLSSDKAGKKHFELFSINATISPLHL